MAVATSVLPSTRTTDTAAYVLRSITDDIPLRGDFAPDDVSITCVEHWNGNLYIGTSASELLHLVAIPGEDEHDPTSYILASRLQPGGHKASNTAQLRPGVQQILVLPGPSKACVLCNGVVSFYTLPELSPAYTTKDPTGVQWIGGFDENEGIESPEGHVIMLANSRRILLVQIGERLRQFGTVDYPGCLRSSRRDTIACVANATSYALLEVKHQQQIPLVPISAVSTQPLSPTEHTGQTHSPSGHSRSTSLGNPLIASTPQVNSSPTNPALKVPNKEQREVSPPALEAQNSGGRPRSSTDVAVPSLSRGRISRLRPHVLSPTPNEFMLTTGTVKSEPGVGVFFNLDGDPSRGAIEFERYPEDILIHHFKHDVEAVDDDQRTILALIDGTDTVHNSLGIEIQELAGQAPKSWISLPEQVSGFPTGGLHKCLTDFKHTFLEITDLLRSVRFRPSLPNSIVESDPRTQASIRRLEQETALFEDQSPQTGSPTVEYEESRNDEEKKYVLRLGQTSSYAVVWSGKNIWQIVQAPILLNLESMLLRSGFLVNNVYNYLNLDKAQILSLLGGIRDQEPDNEVEVWTLKYIRQKASIVLFLHLQASMKAGTDMTSACQIVRNALQEGTIDPRVVLLLIPPLAREVVQGPHGIWLPSGIVDLLKDSRPSTLGFQDIPIDFWLMIRQYLGDWQEKRGYGSITDEKYVSDSVDSSMLHVLLYLDQALPGGSGVQTSVRAKLNNIVDYWKGDFHRAVILLEHYRRLFLLSRLYQSKKLAKDVLATWKRIVEGEKDEDKSLTIEQVELQVRRYLTKIGNTNLVQEYGLWLAQRNPKLAVQVFADDNSRVKLTSTQVTAMLKDKAPGAVQQYLEHLVFGKNQDQYADDLIGYYLDSIIGVLEESPAAKESLEQSYASYRALQPPKPTYLNFIADNAPPQPWWHSRLRLLQLLGAGGHSVQAGTTNELSYSVEKVLEKVVPFSSYLVSESIILDARRGRHEDAIRLLTHGLGDFDTAVRYCYFAGPAPQMSKFIDGSVLPSKDIQKTLFSFLLKEFMKIEDIEERLDRTSHLLGKFAPWFDPLAIFSDLPADWTVDMLSEFILRSLRAATSEKNEAIILKALSAAEYLQKQVSHIEFVEKAGPWLETGAEPEPAAP